MSGPQSKEDQETAEKRALYEEAAGWLMRLKAGEIDEADRAYTAWRAQSEAHEDAMSRARIIWGFIGDKANAPEAMAARRDALMRSTAKAAGRWRLASWGLRTKVSAVAAAMLVIAAPAALFLTPPDPSTEIAAVTQTVFETKRAETRTVTLADNSRVSLDAATRLEVRYSMEAREITLLDGQAHFDVAKDESRPFRVTAGDKTVVATGTEFNVEMVGAEVFVTLLEGEVIVKDAQDVAQVLSDASGEATAVNNPALSATSSAVTLKPGQQLTALMNAAPVIEPSVNLEKTNAWRQGKVFLEDDPLTVAVARMNRYSQIRMRVAGGDLEEIRVGGVFDAGDTDAFIDAVEATFPVKAQRLSASVIEFRRDG